MSDDWIVLVPDKPRYVPDQDSQEKSRQRLSEMTRDADEVECVNSEHVQFFDCGSNLEVVRCPNCKSEISWDWWGKRMDDDYKDGFRLASYETPCCRSSLSLDRLIYDWPIAFGRFALSARNPDMRRIQPEHILELGNLLKCRLTAIRRHI